MAGYLNNERYQPALTQLVGRRSTHNSDTLYLKSACVLLSRPLPIARTRFPSRRRNIYQYARPGKGRPSPKLPIRSAGQRAFSRTALVAQRHTFDRHRAEAGLRFSTGWTGLPETYESLVEVLAETASSGGTGTSCWNLRAKRGVRWHSRAGGISRTLPSGGGVELGRRFSEQPSAGASPRCPAPCPLADFGAVHRARRCPASAPGWPGTAPSCRAPAHPEAPGHTRRSRRSDAPCSPAGADSAVVLAAGARSHGAGRQGEASDSDPVTVAEYVTHCPKILVR